MAWDETLEKIKEKDLLPLIGLILDLSLLLFLDYMVPSSSLDVINPLSRHFLREDVEDAIRPKMVDSGHKTKIS